MDERAGGTESGGGVGDHPHEVAAFCSPSPRTRSSGTRTTHTLSVYTTHRTLLSVFLATTVGDTNDSLHGLHAPYANIFHRRGSEGARATSLRRTADDVSWPTGSPV